MCEPCRVHRACRTPTNTETCLSVALRQTCSLIQQPTVVEESCGITSITRPPIPTTATSWTRNQISPHLVQAHFPPSACWDKLQVVDLKTYRTGATGVQIGAEQRQITVLGPLILAVQSETCQTRVDLHSVVVRCVFCCTVQLQTLCAVGGSSSGDGQQWGRGYK